MGITLATKRHNSSSDTGVPPTYKPYTGPNVWSPAFFPSNTGSTPSGPNCDWGASADTPIEYLSFNP
jgi:hypothetical protein